MSQRDVEQLSFEDNASDVFAVADTLGADHFDFIGLNNYPTVAALQPDRVRRVVLVGPPPMRLAELLDAPDQSAVRSIAPTNWEVFTETHGSFLQGWDPDPSISFAQFIRASVEQADYLRVMAAWRGWDFTEYLVRITSPTLIVSASQTSPLHRNASRIYAAAIAGSRLVEVDGFVAQQMPKTYGIVDSFLDDESVHRPSVASRPTTRTSSADRFRTVLFTDMVDHTAMMQRLGDARGRDVLREHERITRQTLREYDGEEIKTMDDGFLASFSSVTQGVRCAIALHQAFAACRPGDAATSVVEPIEIRIGMNAGEPIEEDGDLFGSTVILAARIAATAEGGEILVPEALPHLLAGKAFSFGDRGAVALKGSTNPFGCSKFVGKRWTGRRPSEPVGSCRFSHRPKLIQARCSAAEISEVQGADGQRRRGDEPVVCGEEWAVQRFGQCDIARISECDVVAELPRPARKACHGRSPKPKVGEAHPAGLDL